MKKVFIISLAFGILASCLNNQNNQNKQNNQSLLNMPDQNDLYMPILFTIGLNQFNLSGTLEDYRQIDSVFSSGLMDLNWETKTGDLSFVAPEDAEWITPVYFFNQGKAICILFKKSGKVNFTFKFDPQGKKYHSVQMAGTINDWNPDATNFSFDGKVWKTNLLLNPGKYNYQLVVDGNWILDPGNPLKEDNNLGGFNSVLQLGDQGSKELPQITTNSFTENELLLDIVKTGDRYLVLWQNFLLNGEHLTITNKNIHIKIPDEAANFNQSYIRVYSFNDEGIGNDLLIPLKGKQLVQNNSQLNRKNKYSQILYFLMVDRFFNGDSSNDKKVNDPEVAERANYYGGDLAGVEQKLDEKYFDQLGINTIWVSPITQNTWGAFREYPEPHRKFSAYHGYWPISLTRVDKRFGTDKEFKNLVEKAHAKNFNIICDFVSNHVHQESPIYQQHPDWATKLDLPDGTKNIRLWDKQRLTTWFDTFLPTIDYTNDEALQTITDSAMIWLEKYHIDGFRHDATKHIPLKYWQTLNKKVKKYCRENHESVYQIGETFGSRELIGSYVGNDLLDAQFDFNLFWDTRSVFATANESFKKLNNSLFESFAYYGWHHLMGNVTGNHDMPRFISFASGALAFDENSQEAGWERDIEVKNPIGYKRLQCLVAFTMSIPGVPIIYYGDEFGMPGAGDPDNRRPMRFNNLSDDENKNLEVTKKLTKFRKNSLALQFGDYSPLLVNDFQFAFARKYFDESVIVVFNKDTKAHTIEIPLDQLSGLKNLHSLMGTEFEIQNQKVLITLEAWSFDLLYTKKTESK